MSLATAAFPLPRLDRAERGNGCSERCPGALPDHRK
jgi:hypothetical protein